MCAHNNCSVVRGRLRRPNQSSTKVQLCVQKRTNCQVPVGVCTCSASRTLDVTCTCEGRGRGNQKQQTKHTTANRAHQRAQRTVFRGELRMLSGAVGIRPSGARPPQEGSVGGGKNSELTFKPTQHDAPKAAKVAFSGRSGKKVMASPAGQSC